MKKRFFIVETWNGEGYSDSRPLETTFETKQEAIQYAKNLVKVNSYEITKSEFFTEGYFVVSWKDPNNSEDDGAYHICELTPDLIAIAITPCVNEIFFCGTTESLDMWINDIKESEDYEEGEDLYNSCYHLDDGEVILFRAEEIGKQEQTEAHKEVEARIIAEANNTAKEDFVTFPDYDPEDPITDLCGALTVILCEWVMQDIDTAEIYDYLNSKLKTD